MIEPPRKTEGPFTRLKNLLKEAPPEQYANILDSFAQGTKRPEGQHSRPPGFLFLNGVTISSF